MAKGYSARRGFSNGAGQAAQQMQMQQKLMQAVDPEDVEMLQDLVISAVNEALRQADDAMSSRMNSFTSGLNIPGLGL